MSSTRSNLTAAQEGFQVGTEVAFRWGVEHLRGTITEDRGPIGIGGRRLYRVEADLGDPTPLVTELPASEMSRVER